MLNIKIYFDGYCPESLLKLRLVEMKLNEDDLWESAETALQMTVFPPYAAILGWRGKGRFRQSPDVASGGLTGLVMTKAKTDVGQEIFPDPKMIIHNKFDLEQCLNKIYESREAFGAGAIKSR